jgi:hypothetical protein
VRPKACWQVRRRTTAFESRGRLLWLSYDFVEAGRLVLTRASLFAAVRAQRQDRLLDSVLVRASISDGLNSTSHGVWARVLHNPERSTRVDLILKVLDGVFELLYTKLVLDHNEIHAVRVTYLDHAITIGTLR